jgi:hypothetical protein
MYSKMARRARSRVDQDWRWISSFFNVENQLSDTALSQHSPGREKLCTIPWASRRAVKSPELYCLGSNGVENQPGRRSTSLERHAQGVDHERGAHVVGHGPTDDPA